MDLERNFERTETNNFTQNKCECNSYWGQSAFSELETQALKNFITSNGNISMYISLHSDYPCYIAYPYSTHNKSAINDDVLETIGNVIVNVIEETIECKFDVGPLSKVCGKYTKYWSTYIYFYCELKSMSFLIFFRICVKLNVTLTGE